MRKFIAIFLFALMLPLFSSAEPECQRHHGKDNARYQDYGKRNRQSHGRKGNWTFGGSFGMSFTSEQNNISVAPRIGYNFNRFFTLGGSISYSHFNNKDFDRKINYLGASLYGRLYPLRFITMFVEPGIQHRWGRIGDTRSKEGMFGTMLVGGGLVIPLGFGNQLIAEVYYDVLQNEYSPYGKNIGYSIGYSFRF